MSRRLALAALVFLASIGAGDPAPMIPGSGGPMIPPAPPTIIIIVGGATACTTALGSTLVVACTPLGVYQ